MTTAHPATAQRLRRRLERLHNSGYGIGELLNNALADNDLTTAGDTAAWLTAALPTPAKPERANPEQWPTLEPLPPADGLSPALRSAAQAEADTYRALTADLPPDNAAAAELREDPARLTTRRDLERAAGYTGTPAPTPPAAIVAAEEAATRLDDMKARYQQQEPARALLAKIAELDEADRGIRYRAAGAASEISNLGILDRSRRKELTALLATLETQRATIAEQRTDAEQQLTELAPQGPRSLVAAPDIERAHHDLADARRDADKATTRHQQALDTHRTRLDAAAAAEEELDRRKQLTPARRNQEQRLRTTITDRKNNKPRQRCAPIDHTNPAATREYQRQHRNTPNPGQQSDTGRDTGL
ncbi:hypothetical protein [Rhodococcus sp. BH5]|uniref:hypothetical protein n=1 Tax=Rhodococcus sp. BH5 TaxID=2871702 RepID=UPI0022CD7BB9|nr:hypothetical protein [Rhodococcus sp. BH5]MCZ9634945.1 hypothetical protein [Rhodococcus sp. BH5]